MHVSTFIRPSALVPLAMSLTALLIVASHVMFFGAARQVDEGASAHLFQLLIAGQLPFVAFFAFKWLRRTPKDALVVLASQALAVVLACAPVWYFKL